MEDGTVEGPIKNMPMTKRAIMRIDCDIVGFTGQVKYRTISAIIEKCKL